MTSNPSNRRSTRRNLTANNSVDSTSSSNQTSPNSSSTSRSTRRSATNTNQVKQEALETDVQTEIVSEQAVQQQPATPLDQQRRNPIRARSNLSLKSLVKQSESELNSSTTIIGTYTSNESSETDKATTSKRRTTVSTLQVSTIETRKRHLSNSYDNNYSKISSTNVSVTSSEEDHKSLVSINSSKRVKLTKSEHVHTPTPEPVSDTEEPSCPVKDCDSSGHLDGFSERHFTYNTCPVYFAMTPEECKIKRVEIEKNLNLINEKIIQLNENKKPTRSKVSLLLFKLI